MRASAPLSCSRPRWGLLAGLLAGLATQSGCAAPAGDSAAATCESGDTEVVLVSALTWSRVEDGVTSSFDLDGEVSDGAGSSGCGVADYVDPEGNPGVDNVFGGLVPALEVTEFAAVESIIAESITNGELLIAMELTGVDSLVDDDCVDFTMLRAAGAPMLSTAGTLLHGQTLAVDPDIEPFGVQGASIRDGVMVAGPVELDLPLTVLGVELLFQLKGGAVRVEFHEDGTASGYFGGGVDVEYVLEVARTEAVDDTVVELMDGLLSGVTDLAPDESGDCTQVSIAMEFQGVGAYLLDDTDR
jgi:hypothetical protein